MLNPNYPLYWGQSGGMSQVQCQKLYDTRAAWVILHIVFRTHDGPKNHVFLYVLHAPYLVLITVLTFTRRILVTLTGAIIPCSFFFFWFIYFGRCGFFTPCVWFLSFRVFHSVFSSMVLLTYYAFIICFFTSFSVARVSHDDEVKLSRERASDPLWVASKGIGRGEGSGRRENAADKAGRR